LDDGVEALGVDALHELEALEGGVGDGGPVDGAGVVDEDVEAAVSLGWSVKVSEGEGESGSEMR
jgi:hypothetical protein